ncbi:MAG: hypothetical protein NT077_01365 [Candidatus Taylorbacteria bacterium]|nr:hypothetical protein [Candidatus Taylorbacteria bacterium]
MITLIESCSPLSIGSITRDMRRAKERGMDLNGFINIEYGAIKAVADYTVDTSGKFDCLIINFGETEQRINLVDAELHFGTRKYFICSHCSRRVCKLYLPPKAKLFKCRHCYYLTYELTSFSRKSKMGQLAYKTNRTIKMGNTREQMRSIFYNGKFTRRFSRFLKLSEAAGFKCNLDDARKLLSALNSN